MKYLPLILRNVFRNKVRSIFTGISIAISIFLVVTLYSFLSHQSELIDAGEQYNRVAILSEGGLAGRLPIAHVDRIRRATGVKSAIPLSWFGGNYREEPTTFPQFATDPAAFFEVYPELTIPPDEYEAWKKDKTGCIVGSVLARNKDWKIGDKLPLQGNIYPVDIELTIRGVYDGPDTVDKGWVVFGFEYFDDALKQARAPGSGNAGIIMLRTNSAASLSPVMQELENSFANSDAPVKPMTEKEFGASFLEMLGNVQGFIRMTSFAVVVALLCVAANTMAMSLRERTREIALLKAIGFSQTTVLIMYLSESILIGLFGGIVGALGAKLLFASIDLSSVDPGLGIFFIPWSTALWGLSLASVVGLLSGIIPAWRAAHVSVIDGLRKVV
jgi:putative ABC transport system permease protein